MPHNVYLDVLVSKGLLTLIAFLATVGLALYGVWRATRAGGADPRHQAIGMSILVALIGMLGEGLFMPVTTALPFLTMLALACAFAGSETVTAASD